MRTDKIREPLNKSLSFRSKTIYVPIFALDKGYLDEKAIIPRIFNHDFLKKGRLPLYQVAGSFRPAIASEYRLAQANMAYKRFSFFFNPRYTVFL